jgi:hypothetical protein
VAWRFLYFSREMAEQDPAFDECGDICGSSGNVKAGYCDTCPVKEAEAAFKEDCMGWLDQRAGSCWQNYGFDHLLATVLNVINLEDLPSSQISVKAGRLQRAVSSERNRIKRIDAWNKRPKKGAK